MAEGTKTAELIARGARAALAAVFVYAGAVKALDPAEFALAIDNYRLLPFPLSAALALYLPWMEIVCGLGLLRPRLRQGALSLLLLLCLIFTTALTSALARGLDVTCGCFGGSAGGRLPLLASLVRSVLLAAAAGLFLLRWEKRPDGVRGDG